MPFQIFVHHLTPDITPEQLRELFSEMGNVIDVQRPTDRETGAPRKFAFVTMSDEAEALAAIERFNGIELDGLQIEVKQATERKKKPDKKLVMKLANEINRKLKEEAKRPQAQIRRIIELGGEEFARQLFADTLKILGEGGMMTNDSVRTRTPGGVFFKLAKDRLPAEIRAKIFPSWRELKQRRKAMKVLERAKKAAQEAQNPQKSKKVAKLPLDEVRQQLEELQQAEAAAQARLADIQAGRVRGGMLEAMREVTQIKSKINALLKDYPEAR